MSSTKKMYEVAQKYGREKFKEMVLSAESQQALGKKLGLSQYALRMMCKELGITRPVGRPKKTT